MRKYMIALLAVVVVVLSFSTQSYAQGSGVGVGMMLGEPTGLSAKFWTSGQNAIDVGIGWSNNGSWEQVGGGYVYYYTQSHFDFHADYLWHDFHAIKSRARFPLYYGLGLTFESATSVPTALGLRGVGGIEWMPRSAPFDIFLEIAPVFYLAPTTGLSLEAGLGARFFFQ